MRRVSAIFSALLLPLLSCTIETAPLAPRDAGNGNIPPHTHDWSDLTTGPRDGKVGIGTSEPAALIHANGTVMEPLTGLVSVLAGSMEVSGATTYFSSELRVGDAIRINDEIFTVAGVDSDTSLLLDSAHVTGASGATAYRDPPLLSIDTGDGTSKLTVTQHGGLGVGTANPEELLEVAGGARARNFNSWKGAFQVTGDSYTVQLPALDDWDSYLINARAGCDYNGADWSFAGYTFIAQTLSVYPKTVTETAIAQLNQVITNNNRASSISLIGGLNGAISMTVMNCDGHTVYVSYTRFGY